MEAKRDENEMYEISGVFLDPTDWVKNVSSEKTKADIAS